LEHGQRLVQPHHVDRFGAQCRGALLERGDQRRQRLDLAAQVGCQRIDGLLAHVDAGKGRLRTLDVDRGVMLSVVAQSLERLIMGVGYKLKGRLHRTGAFLAQGVAVDELGQPKQ